MQKNKIIFLLFTALLSAVCFIACTNSNTPEIKNPVIEPSNPYAAVDKSPMDMSYYPVNYPTLKMSGTDTASLTARLIYSRPQKNGRAIFGNEPPPKYVQQYGALWRLKQVKLNFLNP
jgi:hypothetical protein